MSYYSETALSTKDMPICEQVHDAVKFPRGMRGADLLAFPECEEYMACSITSGSIWHKRTIEGMTGRFQNKMDSLRLKDLYKERFQGTWGNRSIYFMFVGLLATVFYSAFFFPFFEIFVTAHPERSLGFYQDVYISLYPMAVSFVLIKYFQYKLWNDDSAEGYVFNRLNGMVEHRLPDETICIPFNEFRPLAVQSRDAGGNTRTGLMLFHDKMNLGLPVLTWYLADAIISWCYLKQFMDISRPLPDIPEHEATRHLDPTTQRYDEETGRDPFYWRNKTEKEIKQLETEARKRVRAHYKEGVYFQ